MFEEKKVTVHTKIRENGSTSRLLMFIARNKNNRNRNTLMKRSHRDDDRRCICMDTAYVPYNNLQRYINIT